MVETPDQIEGRIREERGRLGRNLTELEGRVRDAANWRTHFNRHPLAVMGAAFGAGLLAAQLTTRRGVYVTDGRNVHPSALALEARHAPGLGGETWRNIRAALVGLTGAGVQRFLNDVLPGFQEHYERARYGRMSPS